MSQCDGSVRPFSKHRSVLADDFLRGQKHTRKQSNAGTCTYYNGKARGRRSEDRLGTIGGGRQFLIALAGMSSRPAHEDQFRDGISPVLAPQKPPGARTTTTGSRGDTMRGLRWGGWGDAGRLEARNRPRRFLIKGDEKVMEE